MHAQEAHDSAHEVEAGHGAHGDHGAQTYPLPYDGPFDAQDVRTMGGLARYMPATNLTFLVATLAIAGIPGLAGFFSKDEILFRAFEHGYNGHLTAWLVWGVGMVTALLTAFYMTRVYVLTFKGTERWPDAARVKPHESPWTMTVPLWVLGTLSVVGGYLGLPAVVLHAFGLESSWIHHWLVGEGGVPVADSITNGVGAPGTAAHGAAGTVADVLAGGGTHGAAEAIHTAASHVPAALEWALLALGAAVAIGGVLWAWRAYTMHGLAFDVRIRERFGSLYTRASEKWNWDEFYERTVHRFVLWLSEAFALFDRDGIDGWGVNGLARASRGMASSLRRIQTGFVQSYALAIVLGAVLLIALILFA